MSSSHHTLLDNHPDHVARMSADKLKPVRYRADIDGLRAIAVIAVILFHAGIAGVAGGFFGVDVFFVVSGFLITSQLASSEKIPLRALLIEFYLRRARRILPALWMMLIVATAVSLWLLLPSDLAAFGRSLSLSAAFLGNFAVWLGGGYFARTTASLVHLWSIGVEEQFYFAYPLLLIVLVRRCPRYPVMPFIVLASLSFAACFWASDAHPFVNFLSTPLRGWEFLLGAATARAQGLRALPRWLHSNVGLVSLALLIYVLVFGQPVALYPGWHAILPCVATCGLIATGWQDGPAARILAIRPLVFVGLISYSLYLWHAPVLAGLRYFMVWEPGGAALAAAFTLIFAVAALSYRYVEQPVRRREIFASNRRFVLAAAAIGAVIVASGMVLFLSSGLPRRFSPQVLALTNQHEEMHPDVKRCTSLSDPEVAMGRLCRFGSKDSSAPKVVVWGDSHSMVLLREYERIAKERNLAVYLAARSSCRPLMGIRVRTFPSAYARICEEFNEATASAIRRIDPALVVLNGFWVNPSMDLVITSAEPSKTAAPFVYGIQESLRRADAARRDVCVVLDPPQLQVVLPYMLAMAERRGLDANEFAVSRDAAFAQQRQIREFFGEIGQARPLTLVNLTEPLCRASRCLLRLPDGRPLYNDTNHLSAAGARFTSGELEKCFARFGERAR